MKAGADLTITSTAVPIVEPIAQARRRTVTAASGEKFGLYITDLRKIN
jgi:hypothetical protein